MLVSAALLCMTMNAMPGVDPKSLSDYGYDDAIGGSIVYRSPDDAVNRKYYSNGKCRIVAINTNNCVIVVFDPIHRKSIKAGIMPKTFLLAWVMNDGDMTEMGKTIYDAIRNGNTGFVFRQEDDKGKENMSVLVSATDVTLFIQSGKESVVCKLSSSEGLDMANAILAFRFSLLPNSADK